MRRLGRYIYNGLTMLSLLICLATVVLWVSKERYNHLLGYHSRREASAFFAGRAGIEYEHFADDLDDPSFWPAAFGARLSQGWHFERSEVSRLWSPWWDMGEGFRDIEHGPSDILAAPTWCPLLVFGLLPFARLSRWALIARAKRRRKQRRRCPVCAYDLRATPERCPECGTASQQVESYPRLK